MKKANLTTEQKAVKIAAQKALDTIYKEFKNCASANNFSKLNLAMLNFQEMRNNDWKLEK